MSEPTEPPTKTTPSSDIYIRPTPAKENFYKKWDLFEFFTFKMNSSNQLLDFVWYYNGIQNGWD